MSVASIIQPEILFRVLLNKNIVSLHPFYDKVSVHSVRNINLSVYLKTSVTFLFFFYFFVATCAQRFYIIVSFHVSIRRGHMKQSNC